ncbi:unnamed protein product [Camellia sinensis]
MQKFQLPIKVGQQLPRCQLPFLIAFFFFSPPILLSKGPHHQDLCLLGLSLSRYISLLILLAALSSISKPLHSKVQLLLIYLLLHSTHKSLLALEEFSHLALLFWTTMADLEHSTSDDASVDSRAEDPSQDSKLEFSEDEETLITRMYNLVGERWSLIAGRIPGRTAEEIEKYWNSRYSTSG